MEYRKRCNVCGKIWCYTDEDLRRNESNSISSTLASLGAIANVFGGTTYKAFELNKMADRNSAKIVDYSRCPYCNSSDISDVGEDEWKKLEQSHQASTSNTRSVVINDNASREALLKRVRLFMDDGDWDSAKAYCEHLLDADPEDGDVYFLELLIELRVKSIDEIIKNRLDLCGSKNYAKAQKYGSAGVTDLLSYAIKEMDYNEADRLAQEGTAASLSRAAEMFASQPEHRDSAARAENCRVQIAQLQQAEREQLEQEAKEREEAERRRAEEQAIAQAERERAMARGKKIAVPVLAAAGVIAAVALVVTQMVIPQDKYHAAEKLLSEGSYDEAIAAFEAMGDYKDSAERVTEAKYAEAVFLQENGETARAAIAFGSLGDYQDAKERSMALWDECTVRETISAGLIQTVGLKFYGTVVAVGDNDDGACNVSEWRNIVAISAGPVHTVGLKSDGTVAAVGNNNYRRCNVSEWTDIVAVSAGSYHTVGLKSDGTVVAVGAVGDDTNHGQCSVSDWTEIVAISAGNRHTVGLKSDGTVVAVGDNYFGQCDVSGWRDIVAISAGHSHTVGLKSDGTVVAVGDNSFGQCDVSGWTDIVAISAGTLHTVGLKSDGTMVAVGSNHYGECDVSGWRDIVAISAGESHTVGLKSDGTVSAVGYNYNGQCGVSGWTNIKVPSGE